MTEAERKDTPEQAEFRAHCQTWLENNHPGAPPVHIPQGALELSDPAAMDWLKTWQKSAYDAGLIGCDYPVEHGGGGKDNCQAIANQEMQRAKTPYLPNIIGMGMAAPTIFFHAQEEVKAELLPRLLSGEDIWCQGFSERVPAPTWPISRPLHAAMAITGSSTATRSGPPWRISQNG